MLMKFKYNYSNGGLKIATAIPYSLPMSFGKRVCVAGTSEGVLTLAALLEDFPDECECLLCFGSLLWLLPMPIIMTK